MCFFVQSFSKYIEIESKIEIDGIVSRCPWASSMAMTYLNNDLDC